MTPPFAGASETGQMRAPQHDAGPRTDPWVMSKGSPVVLEPVPRRSAPLRRVWDAMGDSIVAAAVRCDRGGHEMFDDPSAAPGGRPRLSLPAPRRPPFQVWVRDADLGMLCPACRAERDEEKAAEVPLGWDDGPGSDEYEGRLKAHVSCYCDPDSAEGARAMV